MKITFLGVSHGFCEPGRFCSSAVITTGGRHYVIDAGAPVTGLFRTYGFEYEDLSEIFITHSHSDHYMGLVELTNQIEGFGEFSDVRINVHVPEEFPSARINTFLFGNPEGKVRPVAGAAPVVDPYQKRVRFINYPDGESVIFDDGNIKITAIPTMHIKHAHAFLVECEGKRVFFSGDLAKDFPDLPPFLTDENEKKLNLVIIEGAHTRYSKPEITELLSKLRTQCLLCTHINYAFNTHEALNGLRDAMKDLFPVVETFDGMVVNI